MQIYIMMIVLFYKLNYILLLLLQRSLDYALSLDTAREMCKNAFNNCSLTLIEGTPVDPTQHIEECALDVAVRYLFFCVLFFGLALNVHLPNTLYRGPKRHEYFFARCGVYVTLSG